MGARAEYLKTFWDLQAKWNYVVNLKTILPSAYLTLSTEERRKWKAQIDTHTKRSGSSSLKTS